MQIEKTPLILIPALMTTKKLYKHQIDTLSDVADITVPVLTEYRTIADMAQAVLEKAPEQFALGGVSMGGHVAFEIMRQAPHRVTRLALIDTKATKDTPEFLKKRVEAIETVNDDTFVRHMKKVIPKYIFPENNQDGRLTDLLMDMAKSMGVTAFINQQTALRDRIDSTPFLKDIKCKTMIVCGREDAILENMREMQDHIPLSRFIIIEKCGHMSPIEQPVAISALIRYWLG